MKIFARDFSFVLKLNYILSRLCMQFSHDLLSSQGNQITLVTLIRYAHHIRANLIMFRLCIKRLAPFANCECTIYNRACAGLFFFIELLAKNARRMLALFFSGCHNWTILIVKCSAYAFAQMVPSIC